MDLLGRARCARIYWNEGDKVGLTPAQLAVPELLRRENAQGQPQYAATRTSARPAGST